MNEDSNEESHQATLGGVGGGTSRRGFLKQVGALGVIAAAGPKAIAGAEPVVPRRRLGRTGENVGIVGLGCIYFRAVDTKETDAIIRTALDLGVNFIEWGPVYGDAQEKVAKAIAGRRDEAFLASKTLYRRKKAAVADLEKILTTCRTDHIDLFSLHAVNAPGEYEFVMGPEGCMEGMIEAKKAGKVRYLGITGHYTPAHLAAIESGQFDVITCVLNPANRETEGLLKVAEEKDVGIATIKPLGAGGLLKEADLGAAGTEQFSVNEVLRFTLSHESVTCVIVGCTSVEQMKQNARDVANFKPLSARERASCVDRGNRIARGLCGNCAKACNEVCPAGVPVAFILERLEFLHRFYYDSSRVGDEYDALSKTVKNCPDGCDLCEKACLHDLPVRERLKEAERRMQNVRMRYREGWFDQEIRP